MFGGPVLKRRHYKVLLLFLPTKGKLLWEWKHWMEFFELINPLVVATRGNKTLQVFQTCDSRKVSGGPMAWTKRNMEKWAHHSPLTEDFSEQLHFSFLELWCPSEKTCSEEQTAPDLFVSLDNDFDIAGLPRGTANQRLLIAIASDWLSPDDNSTSTLISDLIKLTQPLICFELNSPWVIKKNDIFTKSLRHLREFFIKDWNWNDMPSFDMFDTENTRYEIVASYKAVDGVLVKQLNFEPK